MSKNNFVNGVPELLVLRLLAREEMYGYQLVTAIQERSAQAFSFGEGCLYPLLHRLSADKLLLTRHAVVDGRLRYYYRTSAKGQKHLEKLTQEWNTVVQGTQAALGAHYAF